MYKCFRGWVLVGEYGRISKREIEKNFGEEIGVWEGGKWGLTGVLDEFGEAGENFMNVSVKQGCLGKIQVDVIM